MRTRKARAEGDDQPMRYHPGLLRLYEACVENANSLLEDARLLFEQRRFARAYALAFTAFEEIGKSQVVADAYYGLVAVAELTEAFKRHDLKVAYLRRVVRLEPQAPIGHDATIEYDTVGAKPLFEARQRSLYVDFGVDYAPTAPTAAISSDRAEEMISLVQSELDAIAWAETLNGRIGTKGLFK